MKWLQLIGDGAGSIQGEQFMRSETEMTERTEICELTDAELAAVSGGQGAWEAAKQKAGFKTLENKIETIELLRQLE